MFVVVPTRCETSNQPSRYESPNELHSGRQQKPQSFQHHKKWLLRDRSLKCLMENTGSWSTLMLIYLVWFGVLQRSSIPPLRKFGKLSILNKNLFLFDRWPGTAFSIRSRFHASLLLWARGETTRKGKISVQFNLWSFVVVSYNIFLAWSSPWKVLDILHTQFLQSWVHPLSKVYYRLTGENSGTTSDQSHSHNWSWFLSFWSSFSLWLFISLGAPRLALATSITSHGWYRFTLDEELRLTNYNIII